MELKQTIIESNHKLSHDNFDLVVNKLSKQSQIQIVKEKESHQKFYLIQKGEKFNSDQKYSYINYLEKSFNLIHPSIINLAGYSTQKPYLYYKYVHKTSDINFLEMSNENIQKIFIGVASGLSYLLKNGYSYSNFSINSIIFDKNFHPRLIDYINFEDQNKFNELNLVKNYVDFIKNILSIIFSPDKNFNKHINSNLTSLLEKTSTFDDFIQFLSEHPFIKKDETFNSNDIKLYTKILEMSDKIIFDDELSFQTDNKICSIEQICYYFYRKQEMKELNKESLFRLNFLPEYYIKPLVKIISPLSEKLNRYLFNEDISLILPNWKEIQKLPPFHIYKLIMKQLQILEKQKINTIFCDNKSKEISYKIESLRNYAIQFLFEVSKEQPEEAEIKIEIAVQYIKGYLLEYSLEKALSTLESISKTINNQSVIQMKKVINSKINETSIQKVIQDYQDKISIEKIKKAEEEDDVLSMLYLGFAFYTGFNDYPILHSLSHYYYEKAANKSPHAMLLLGFLYFKGIIFPQNLHKAQECFKKSAQNGCIKAEIIDSLLRKHIWRSYLVDFDIDEIFSNFIQPFNFENILSFPRIYYYLESNLLNGKLYELSLFENSDDLASNYVDHKMKPKYNSNHIYVSESNQKPINIKPGYSQKILLSSENYEKVHDVDKLLFIAKSYFYGDNGFPVNYIESAKFFKLAADKGNSEAQWRYALLINNKVGFTPNDSVEFYLKKSAKQNNVKGKFYYSIYLKNIENDIELFEKYIKECCAAGDADSMYFYGMYLEESIIKKETEIKEELTKKNDDIKEQQIFKYDPQYYATKMLKQIPSPKNSSKSLFDDLFGEETVTDDDDDYDLPKKKGPIDINLINNLKHIIGYYEAASRGHFDAFLRLINLIEIKSWEEYLPIGLISDNFLSKLIEYYNKNKEYSKSNILIQIGLIKNPKLFNFYYCDHLLNEIEKEDQMDPSFDIKTNLERAKKLAILAFNNNYPVKYQEKYIFIILRSLVINQEHEKALNFLLKHRDKIHIKNKEYFHLFYKKFDKSLASKNFIPACYYRKQFRYCHEVFLSSSNKLSIFGKLIEYAEETKSNNNNKLDQNNPFAMAIVGKIYKQEKKGLLRNLKKATQYFMHSAKYDCPLGQYYLGKEYYYGRYLNKNKKKAIEYLGLAIIENKEPRAGYYLYKLTKEIKYLQIGVEYGHNRALLKYGRILYNNKNTRNDAISYIRQACVQNFKKAYGFCIKHGIHFIDIKQTYSMTNQKDVKRKSGKNKKVNKSNENKHQKSSGLLINIPGENEINSKFNNNDKDNNYNNNNNSNDDNYNNNDNDNDNNCNDDESISSFSSDYWSD